jgi:phospholipid/cholesterol/gamma-HCH transport system permease protein
MKIVEYEFSKDNSELMIMLNDGVTIGNAKEIDKQFNLNTIVNQAISDDKNIRNIYVDLSALKVYDSLLIAYISEIEKYAADKNIAFMVTGANEQTQKFIDLLKISKDNLAKKNKKTIYEHISGVGDMTKRFFVEIIDFIDFLGKTTASIGKTLIKPSNFRWDDFPGYFNNAGVKALSVNILIVMLLGFIIGWQGALLLRQFGAAPYLAPLVGFSIIRELSPIMVAIVVAGRSGAAFTAEIGTMKVSEELDALETMGFDKFGFLVLPRLLALMIALPILVMICDVVGVLGGLLAGLTTLNITMISYFTSLADMMTLGDVTYGLVKAVVFGFTIALIGCFSGMKVTNSAESVGKQTTSSVVISIFMVIVIDALFVVIYDAII